MKYSVSSRQLIFIWTKQRVLGKKEFILTSPLSKLTVPACFIWLTARLYLHVS